MGRFNRDASFHLPEEPLGGAKTPGYRSILKIFAELLNGLLIGLVPVEVISTIVS
jgi:hypothetical protein